MKNKLGWVSRILLLLSSLGLLVVLFTPIWRIELNAPQYPEGLSLTIHANGLKGNVDIINGLNHYIGMKSLHNEDFFEFTLLPYCIIFFAVFFLLTAILNRKYWLNILFFAFVSFGIIAMVDFWKWEYNYGHNLNPNAAIVVPGMAYQPPLIGFKQLLNFGAYSIPDTGGWIFIGAGVLLLYCVITEWRRFGVPARRPVPASGPVLLFAVLLLVSCHHGPDPIIAGRDNCYLCKMGISEIKYCAEAVTEKGKIYKFDDIQCLLNFLKAGEINGEKVKDIYVADFSSDHSFIKADQAYFLQGGEIHGPMNGTVIAFQNPDSLKQAAIRLAANTVGWHQLRP